MYFKNSTHQYFITDKEYKSFSAIKKLVEPKKDWNEIAKKYAKKHGMTLKEVKNKWATEGKIGRERGTLLHAYKEGREGMGDKVYMNDTIDDIKIIRNIEDLEDGIHLELPLYNHEFEVCGTADKIVIETIEGKRYVDIYDFKTNKKIDFESYYNWKTKSYDKLRHPLSHIMDCNYMIYSLQLSTYAYFLERYKYVPRNLVLIHVQLEECNPEEQIFCYRNIPYRIGNEKEYNVSYMKKDVVTLMKYYKRTRK